MLVYEGEIIDCKEKGLFSNRYTRDLKIVMSPMETDKGDFEVTRFMNTQFIIKMRGPAK